jgi:hypothetical protein
MSEKDKETRFLKNIKKTLDDGSRNLDSSHQSKLTQIRYQALESKSKRMFPNWSYLPAMRWGTVACALLIGVLYFGQPGTVQMEPGLEDIDLLASTDVMEFYEDLEFYSWLAEENIDLG